VGKLRRAKPPLQTPLQLVAVPRLLDHKAQDRLSRGESDHLCSRTAHNLKPYRTLGSGQPGESSQRRVAYSLRPMRLTRPLTLLCVPLLALGVASCSSATSSSSFKGEQHAVAQAISNLQSEATAGEAQKICKNLLASAVTARLNAAHGGCTQALKNQLAEVDSPELTIQSVQLHGASASAPRITRQSGVIASVRYRPSRWLETATSIGKPTCSVCITFTSHQSATRRWREVLRP